MGKILGFIALITIVFSVYFAFREPVSLVFIFAAVVLPLKYLDKLGREMTSIIIIAGCSAGLALANHYTPIFGDEYELRARLNEINKRESREKMEDFDKVSNAESKVSMSLKDPSSARFTGGKSYSSGAICGLVNAKNSFGGYSGNSRYIYYAKNVLLEETEGDFQKYWAKLCN
ncbi:hypothetical protein ABQ333_10895 [Serratia fonticola]|uniref:hypothetical protein n=1 Tax=Serratia fonticola TaxID=47917 RepID=UPI003AAA3F72